MLRLANRPPFWRTSRKNFLFLIGFLALFLVSGCQTAPTRFEGANEGFWKSKVLIRDKKQDKSFILNVNVNAKLGEHLRMDATTPLGSHVASFVMNKGQVRYFLVNQKKFFVGKSTPRSLEPIILAPLDPNLIYNLLFDLPVGGSGWNCKKDSKDFLESCKKDSENLELTWEDRVMDRKMVRIDHPRAQIQINFIEYVGKVQNKKDLFALEVPKGFDVLSFQ